MSLAAINKHPTGKDLRLFGLLLPGFFAVFGFVIGHRVSSAEAARAIWVGGAALCAVYAGVSSVRRAVFLAWSYTTYPIGWMVSHVILGAVFFVVVTPIALLVRALGQDPLQRNRDPSLSSYWVPHDGGRDVRRYFRQF